MILVTTQEEVLPVSKMARRVGVISESLRKHQLIILIVAVVVVVVAGLAVSTVMARQTKIARFDSKMVNIHAEANRISNSINAMKEKVTTTEQAIQQVEQASDEMESALAGHETKVDEINEKVEEVDSRPRVLTSARLVNRLNALAANYNGLRDGANEKLTELRNLDSDALPLNNEISALEDEMASLEAELDAKVDTHKKVIRNIDLDKKSISIYSFSFNDEFRSLVKKSNRINIAPVLDGISQLNSQIDQVNSKISEFTQNIEKRKAVHQDLSEKENHADQILGTLLEIAPR